MDEVGGVTAAVCAVVLFLAGTSKLLDVRNFASQVRSYAVLPRALTAPIAYALPPLEMAVGILLLLHPASGGALAALLFVSFATAVGINLVRGRTELTCGCFGPRGTHRISFIHVVMNLAAAAAAANAALARPAGSAPAVMTAVTLVAAAIGARVALHLLRDAREGGVVEAEGA